MFKIFAPSFKNKKKKKKQLFETLAYFIADSKMNGKPSKRWMVISFLWSWKIAGMSSRK